MGMAQHLTSPMTLAEFDELFPNEVGLQTVSPVTPLAEGRDLPALRQRQGMGTQVPPVALAL